ncbi:MAG: hypothetical protein MMC33_000851 [Icmadophila ericetorum]|nr:hypothetical protein [Icmadophila ericetorum]
MQFSHFIFAFFLYVSLAAAWPWPPSLVQDAGLLLRRQNGGKEVSSSRQSASPSQTNNAGSSNSASTGSSPSSAATITGSSPTDSGSGSASGSAPTAAPSSSTSNQPSNTNATATTTQIAVDPRLPAGGIEMLTPAAIAAPSYYKIGEPVTFGWNYTSLVVRPSAVDILVSCSANNAIYTLATNASVGSTGAVTWDTSAQETGANPLLTETYTLVIHDAAAAITAQPQAGYLATYDQFTFGMYLRQAYSPLPASIKQLIQSSPPKPQGKTKVKTSLNVYLNAEMPSSSNSRPAGWTSTHDAFVKQCAKNNEDANTIVILLETEYPSLAGQVGTGWVRSRM